MENELIDWIRSGAEPWMDFGDAAAYMMMMHPRGLFVKTLPRHSSLLDVGAGDGSLQVLKNWPKPTRKDLRIFAYAMERGAGFENYDGYELGEWPVKTPDFDGKIFDAIFTAHFIEHIVAPLAFIDWCAGRLRVGGRLYIEWPSEDSVALPPLAKFREQNIPLIISAFHDDHTHRDLPDRKEILNALEKSEFLIDQQGVISNPFMEQEALAHFKNGTSDPYALQSAYWSKTRWSQFIVATKK
jgi:SAM-dependent methyltransferase